MIYNVDNGCIDVSWDETVLGYSFNKGSMVDKTLQQALITNHTKPEGERRNE